MTTEEAATIEKVPARDHDRTTDRGDRDGTPPDTMARLGSEAGFGSVERLDTPETETLRFYRMEP